MLSVHCHSGFAPCLVSPSQPISTLLLLLLAACAGPDYRAITDASIATTTGMVSAEAGPEGAMRYRDIPFAKPPVAGRRWAAPRRCTVRSQITPLPDMVMCPQPQSMASGGAVGAYLGSEDCLYLDVYTPGNVAADAPVPVMLWIHGGSNLTGHKGTMTFLG